MTRRTRRNIARFAGLALIAVALTLMAGGGSAGADGSGATLAAKGWWWQAQQIPGATIPPPPNVKPGQLNVQGNPSDPKKGTAFAAVRYAIDANHTVGSFTLNVSDDQGGSSAVLLACRTGSAWSPAEAGDWTAAPHVDDKACINGQRAADGKSWAFAVATLQVDTVLDIAIVPGAGAVFSLVFDAPANDSLVTTAVSPPTVSTVSSNATPTTVAAGSSAAVPSASGSTFHAPAVAPVATGLPSDKVGETATSPAKQAASQPGLNTAVAASEPVKDRNKTPGYIVLAFAAAVALYAWRQDNLMAMNGGSLPGTLAEPAGLGRFSRPRQGQPPALT